MDAIEMVWDLSQLVESTDSGSIQKALDSMVAEARKVRGEYHGKIGSLDAKGVLGLLELRDTLTLRFARARREKPSHRSSRRCCLQVIASLRVSLPHSSGMTLPKKSFGRKA